MAITKNGQGQILYSEPRNKQRSDATGTAVDNEFAIVDQTNVLKQIQFTIVPLDTNSGVLTIEADIAGDQTIVLSSLPTTSFTTFQPDVGTSPVADSGNDTLILTSSDSSVSITGNSTTDTLDFKVGQIIDSRNWFIETPYDRTYTIEQFAKYGYTVEDVTVITGSGTTTLAFKIDGTNITSLSAVAASSVESTTSSSGAKTVAVGNTLTMVASSSAAPDSLAVSIKIKRT